MDLTLKEHIRNTISLLYKQRTGWNVDIWNFFSEKNNFGHFGLYFAENQHFLVGHVLITSLWSHTSTDFHDFDINRKMRLYPTMVPNNYTFGVSISKSQAVVTPLRKTC